jgi:hypothetical protein
MAEERDLWDHCKCFENKRECTECLRTANISESVTPVVHVTGDEERGYILP